MQNVNYFYKLLEAPYEENRQAREQRAEEEKKKSEEKKATYSSPEMKKVIESFNKDFYNFCDKDYGKVPEELKQRVNELPQEQNCWYLHPEKQSAWLHLSLNTYNPDLCSDTQSPRWDTVSCLS